MGYADKFNKRSEAKAHVVWEEWFWDYLKFGGRFEEKCYVVTRPRPERKTTNLSTFTNGNDCGTVTGPAISISPKALVSSAIYLHCTAQDA